MPADARRLAEEAIDLAGKATPGPWEYDPHDDCVVGPSECLGEPVLFDCFEASASDGQLAAHAGTHYATIAHALIEAMDNYQFMVDRAADEKLDGYRELGARAAVAENDRDALLADLPHALNTCGCKESFGYVPGTEFSGAGYSGGVACAQWPESHTAAIERLEGLLATRNGDRMTACGELREAGDG